MNNSTHIPFKYSDNLKENDADLQHVSILNENLQTRSLSNMMIPLKKDTKTPIKLTNTRQRNKSHEDYIQIIFSIQSKHLKLIT